MFLRQAAGLVTVVISETMAGSAQAEDARGVFAKAQQIISRAAEGKSVSGEVVDVSKQAATFAKGGVSISNFAELKRKGLVANADIDKLGAESFAGATSWSAVLGNYLKTPFTYIGVTTSKQINSWENFSVQVANRDYEASRRFSDEMDAQRLNKPIKPAPDPSLDVLTGAATGKAKTALSALSFLLPRVACGANQEITVDGSCLSRRTNMPSSLPSAEAATGARTSAEDQNTEIAAVPPTGLTSLPMNSQRGIRWVTFTDESGTQSVADQECIPFESLEDIKRADFGSDMFDFFRTNNGRPNCKLLNEEASETSIVKVMQCTFFEGVTNSWTGKSIEMARVAIKPDGTVTLSYGSNDFDGDEPKIKSLAVFAGCETEVPDCSPEGIAEWQRLNGSEAVNEFCDQTLSPE